MGFIARMLGLETRQASMPVDPYWANWFAMRAPGFPSPDAVLSNLAVAARCVQLRSEILASVPLFLFRRTSDGGREKADDNPLYGVLHDIANDLMSAYEAREFMVRCLDLYGNSYARIIRNQRGQVTELIPYLPGDVQIEYLPNGRLRYKVQTAFSRRVEIYLQEEILHLKGASRDGIIGWSPITIARGALHLALAQQSTSQGLADNSLRPSGMLTYPQQLSRDQKEGLRQDAANLYAGAANAGKLLVVDAGATFKELSFTPEDAQFLEQKKLTNEDVARIFACPPTTVGLVDKATYSNTEQESRALVQNCIGPLASRIEAAMSRCLLTDASRRTYYIEHDLDGLLRGDVKSRYESYRVGRECGALSANDIRRLENMPPIVDGNGYNQPANWAPLGSTAPAPGAPTP
jgi:HK97 family phage portal protein